MSGCLYQTAGTILGKPEPRVLVDMLGGCLPERVVPEVPDFDRDGCTRNGSYNVSSDRVHSLPSCAVICIEPIHRLVATTAGTTPDVVTVSSWDGSQLACFQVGGQVRCLAFDSVTVHRPEISDFLLWMGTDSFLMRTPVIRSGTEPESVCEIAGLTAVQICPKSRQDFVARVGGNGANTVERLMTNRDGTPDSRVLCELCCKVCSLAVSPYDRLRPRYLAIGGDDGSIVVVRMAKGDSRGATKEIFKLKLSEKPITALSFKDHSTFCALDLAGDLHIVDFAEFWAKMTGQIVLEPVSLEDSCGKVRAIAWQKGELHLFSLTEAPPPSYSLHRVIWIHDSGQTQIKKSDTKKSR